MRINSFGFRHRPGVAGDLVVDLRDHFSDPLDDLALRELTGHDDRVRAHVLGTPGIADLLDAMTPPVLVLAHVARRPIEVGFGCGGGRHRAPVAARELGARLRRAGLRVVVDDLDLHRPVLPSPRR